MKRRHAFALTISFLVLGAAGCSEVGRDHSGDSSGNTDDSVEAVVDPDILSRAPDDGVLSADGLVKKDYATGALPGDSYRIADLRVRDYAIDVFVQKCMAEQALSYPVAAFDWNDPTMPQFSPASLSGAFTPDKAQQFGYHRPPDVYRQAVRETQSEIETLSQDPAWNEAHQSCLDQFPNNEPFASEGDASTDMGQYAEGVEDLPEIRKAAQQWRECMAPLGIPDLPETPGLAPSVAEFFGLDSPDTETEFNSGTISQDEIAIAVADAKCRIESKYERLVYDAYWVSQEEAIAENSSDYAARLTSVKAANDSYKEYIESQNG